MIARSTSPEVRNPLLRLPSVRRLALEMGEGQAALLAEALAEISDDARLRAEASWRRHKAPMAAYWKAVAVYSRHLRLALRLRDLPAHGERGEG